MSFGTVINCMDGRVQLPVLEYLRQRFGVDYVDSITEAGPDGILARQDDAEAVEAICRKVTISRTKHGSQWLAVVGHADCAGNPVSAEEHGRQLLLAVEYLRRRFPGMGVLGLWVDENWSVGEVIH